MQVFNIVLSLWLVTLVHELGHAGAGRLLGYRVLGIAIGSEYAPRIRYTHAASGFSLSLSPYVPSGYTYMNLTGIGRFGNIFISFAGPFANCLAAAAVFVACSALGFSHIADFGAYVPWKMYAGTWSFFHWFNALNAMIALSQLVPFTGSDGDIILRALINKADSR